MPPTAVGTSRTREIPARDTQFAHLDLDSLRRYRTTLSAEEGRVSYWRRIIQARLDVVRVAAGGAEPPSVGSLRDVFAERRMASNRTALVEVMPVDDMPPLPDLAQLWARCSVPGDDAANRGLTHDLVKAERQLSAYRAALHRRLAAATGELIARYREDPAQCLTVLPVRPPGQRRAAGG